MSTPYSGCNESSSWQCPPAGLPTHHESYNHRKSIMPMSQSQMQSQWQFEDPQYQQQQQQLQPQSYSNSSSSSMMMMSGDQPGQLQQPIHQQLQPHHQHQQQFPWQWTQQPPHLRSMTQSHLMGGDQHNQQLQMQPQSQSQFQWPMMSGPQQSQMYAGLPLSMPMPMSGQPMQMQPMQMPQSMYQPQSVAQPQFYYQQPPTISYPCGPSDKTMAGRKSAATQESPNAAQTTARRMAAAKSEKNPCTKHLLF